MQTKLILLVFLSFFAVPNVSAEISEADRKAHQVFFKPNQKQGFFSKLFFGKKKTFSEFMISTALRKESLNKINSAIKAELEELKEIYGDGTEEYEDAVFYDKYDLAISPDWDYQTNLTKVIIFKSPASLFDPVKNLRVVKYGLADSEDKIVCEADNAGLYYLSDEDLDYLARVYGVEVDKKNRDVLLAYYQPVCLMNQGIRKRLIAFEDIDEERSVTVLKYDHEAHNALLRRDYEWFDKPEEDLSEL